MSDELYVGMKAAMVAYLRYGADHYESSPDAIDALEGIAAEIEAGDFEDVCLAQPEVANGTYGKPEVHALRLLDDWSAIARERGPRWFCNCGHRATSADDHAAHVAEVTL